MCWISGLDASRYNVWWRRKRRNKKKQQSMSYRIRSILLGPAHLQPDLHESLMQVKKPPNLSAGRELRKTHRQTVLKVMCSSTNSFLGIGLDDVNTAQSKAKTTS
jgi:hypothetical protein